MQTTTTEAHRPMPKTPAAAVERVRHLLADLDLLPPGDTYRVAHQATGRHLERVVVCVPIGRYAESQTWYDKLVPVLPWRCRVTVVPEVGRIEIEPRGK